MPSQIRVFDAIDFYYFIFKKKFKNRPISPINLFHMHFKFFGGFFGFYINKVILFNYVNKIGLFKIPWNRPRDDSEKNWNLI